MFPKTARLRGYRRAMLLYLATIVAPVCLLLWLGLDSFERQRQAIRTLSQEKLDAKVEAEARAAAATAIIDRKHPIAKHFFVIDQGQVVEPALRTPLPRAAPPDFAAAERLELALKRPDLALSQYRALLAQHRDDSLALHFIARSLGALGRERDARDTWRTRALQFPDNRDLSGRPYGIVAAINAGDTIGLFEKISSGRWELPADQAEHFLATLDPNRAAPYLERFQFARSLEEQFKPPTSPRPGETEAYAFASHRVFHREDGPGRIVGFEADPPWMMALEQRARADLNIEDTSRQAICLYVGATVLVLLMLSAGSVILLRDVSRDARMSQLRADFVNGVTHDLKTPVTIMRLYGETLLRQRDLSEADRRDFYLTGE